MGRTSRHIRNILKDLKSKNWIDWEKQGYSQSNRYFINEELYFLNDIDDGKSTSSDSGTAFPLQIRTPFPANEYQERNQLKESYKYVPCDKKGCDKGYIINQETNTARMCGCIQGWIRKLNDGTTPIT